MRAIGGHAAIVQRCFGCHAGLLVWRAGVQQWKACGSGADEMLEGKVRRLGIAGAGRRRRGRVQLRSLLAPGVRGPRRRRGTYNWVFWSERLGFSVVPSNGQALGRGVVAREFAGAVQVQSLAAGGGSRCFGVGAVCGSQRCSRMIGKRSGSHSPDNGDRTTVVYPDTVTSKMAKELQLQYTSQPRKFWTSVAEASYLLHSWRALKFGEQKSALAWV